MTWTYEPTRIPFRYSPSNPTPRYTVRRVRTITIDLGGVPGLGGLDTVEVDHSYRHGTSYDTSREARDAARALNMGKCSDCGSPLNSRGYCGNGMIKAVKR